MYPKLVTCLYLLISVCAIPQFLDFLPDLRLMGLLSLIGLGLSLWQYLRAKGGICILAEVTVLFTLLVVGITYSAHFGHLRLAERLDSSQHNQVGRLIVKVTGTATYTDQYVQFPVELLQFKPAKGISKTLLLTWSVSQWLGPYRQPIPQILPDIKPGQVWQLYALLKKPQTLLTPGQMDKRNYLFAQGFGAVGQIKGEPKQINLSQSKDNWSVEMVPDQLRSRLQAVLQDKRYGSIMVALVMGTNKVLSKRTGNYLIDKALRI